MALSILFFFLLALPCFSAPTKDANLFQEFQRTAESILQSESPPRDELRRFNVMKATLSEHEFREGEVDRLSERVDAHLRNLEELIHKKSFYVFADYSSWQEDLTLKTPTEKRNLIVSNQAWCPGLGLGKRNSRYHFAAEACLLFGRGDVGSQTSTLTYQQSNVYGRGVKFTPTAGMFFSSAGAELGVKFPLLWFDQSFSDPKLSGYSTGGPAAFHAFASVYARWPLGSWFLQTDVGKNFGSDLTLWSLGIGKTL